MKSVLPSTSGNLPKTLLEVVKSGDRAAYAAMFQSLLGILAVPVDLAMTGAENRRLSASSEPALPILFVCGPPRSGTTLAAQLLSHALQVSWFNNLTAVFPRAPVTANTRFRGALRDAPADFHAFYGKTSGLAALNDGLHLWDRWFTGDRNIVPDRLDNAASLRRFFGSWEQYTGMPLVNKNNPLNTCAHLVAPLLPTAFFVCLERSPLYLGQSLLVARQKITGDPNRPYGILPAELAAQLAQESPEVSVARQVAYYRAEAKRQQALVSPQRFRTWNYERFCRSPSEFAAAMSEWTGIRLRSGVDLPAEFTVRDSRTIDQKSFAALENALSEALADES